MISRRIAAGADEATMPKAISYFFYVSDAKVQMLYDQLRSNQPLSRTRSVSLKGGIGRWFGIERHIEEAAEPGRDLLGKLGSVTRVIRRTEILGRVSKLSAGWMEDTFPCHVYYPLPSETGAPVVLFQYRDPPESLRPHTQLLLFGSAAFLMPHSASKVEPLPPGGHWRLLSDVLRLILDGAMEEADAMRYPSIPHWLASDGLNLVGRPQGPVITVRSMFRVFYVSDLARASQTLALGTPLYVELVNAETSR